MIQTFSYLTSWEMVFPFLGITTKIRKKGSSYTESKLHLFFFNSLFFDAFWMNSQLHCWMAFTVLVEEWLHRCVRLNRHPEIFFPGKSPWTWNCTLAWPLHCTSLGSIVICFWWWARYSTQLFELWTRPVETDTAKYIFLVSANDFLVK